MEEPDAGCEGFAAIGAILSRGLGLYIIMDFCANLTLTGGLCLQAVETWRELIRGKEIHFGSNASEIYFEEDDFDAFLERLKGLQIHYVYPATEHARGQRAVRFYDPDRHIIEVGETL